MRFLLNVCAASRSMHNTLTQLGHDVLLALEAFPYASDEELLALANAQRRTIITEDKDFGELVFVRRLPHPCIVRLTEMTVDEKVDAVRELVDNHDDAMRERSLIVVTRNQIRIRRVENHGRGIAV